MTDDDDGIDWMDTVPDPREEVVDLLAAAWCELDDPAARALLVGCRHWSTPAERAAARALALPLLAGSLTVHRAAADQLGARLRERGEHGGDAA